MTFFAESILSICDVEDNRHPAVATLQQVRHSLWQAGVTAVEIYTHKKDQKWVVHYAVWAVNEVLPETKVLELLLTQLLIIANLKVSLVFRMRGNAFDTVEPTTPTLTAEVDPDKYYVYATEEEYDETTELWALIVRNLSLPEQDSNSSYSSSSKENEELLTFKDIWNTLANADEEQWSAILAEGHLSISREDPETTTLHTVLSRTEELTDLFAREIRSNRGTSMIQAQEMFETEVDEVIGNCIVRDPNSRKRALIELYEADTDSE